MSSAKTTLPNNPYTFGDTFSYASWTPGTTVTMCNVPWNSDYRDIAYFANNAALNAYIDSKPTETITIPNLTYARFGDPVRINTPFNIAQQYNYLRVTNSAQPINGPGIGSSISGDISKTFYYFITDVRFINPNTTELLLELDVWQTFHNVVSFGNCYVERGHVGIANQNSFDDNGRSYLTVPEGLDIGNEYQIEDTFSYDFATADAIADNKPTSYDVIVVSTTDLTADPGDMSNPNLQSASGSQFESLPNGCQIIWFKTYQDCVDALGSLSNYPWVTQGIISITAIPPILAINGEISTAHSFNTSPATVGYVLDYGTVADTLINLKSNWRDSIDLGRYSNLKKFLTYPYCAIELTTYNGTPLVLKPECIPSNDISVLMKMHVVPPSPRCMFIPQLYNAKAGNTAAEDGEWLDMSTGIFDFPTFSVTNNGYMSFMAANAHRIAYSYQSADWSQQKALQGNTVAYGQAGAAITNTAQQNAIGVNAANRMRDLHNNLATQQGVVSGLNTLMGGVGQAASGNPAGAVASVGQGALNNFAAYSMSVQNNNQSTAIGNSASTQSTNANIDTARYMQSSNKAYADYAARGDYSNEIAGINARVQDAKLIQPTTAGQIGGDAFNLAMYKWSLQAKVKLPQMASRRAIGEYWLRYGYAVSQFSTMPTNFQVMSKFTYWKLKETYLTGTIPETFRQTIRGIFEKGVTVWADPSYIGYTDLADNQPLTGVTL